MTARRRIADLALIAGVGAAATALFAVVGLPSPALFGPLVGGLVHALSSRPALELPTYAGRAAQAVIGATIGAMVSLAALQRMVHDLPEIVLVTAGTLLLSLAAGYALALRRDVTRVTGVFALIAGGASGVVAVAHDLGADDRVVAVVQYLRVLAVVAAMPLVAAVVFAADTGGGLAQPDPPLLGSLAFVTVTVIGGLLVARLTRGGATAYLLAPMVIGVVLAAGGWLGPVGVPEPVQAVGYAIVGIQVGLRFTRESMVAIARMLPVVLLLLLALIVTCAGLGLLLTWTTTADALTGYLATTPGGLWAVLVIAAEADADVTYVTAVQLFRLLVILAMMPLLARWLRRPAGR